MRAKKAPQVRGFLTGADSWGGKGEGRAPNNLRSRDGRLQHEPSKSRADVNLAREDRLVSNSCGVEDDDSEGFAAFFA